MISEAEVYRFLGERLGDGVDLRYAEGRRYGCHILWVDNGDIHVIGIGRTWDEAIKDALYGQDDSTIHIGTKNKWWAQFKRMMRNGGKS